MSKDYYKILGIEKSASQDDVKKAFRKLAHEYHPDKKTGNEAKFKEINEAYGVLSDNTKRKQYDAYGNADFAGAQGFGGGQGFGGFDFSGFQGGFQQGNGSVEFDIGDIFGDIFGGGRQRTQKGRDISTDMELTFEESVFGVEKNVILNKVSVCDTCLGTGAKKGSAMDTCTTCNGQGKVREIKRSIIGSFESVRTCETCHGNGKIPREKCETCKGKGILRRDEDIKVSIPAGIENGQTISYRGKGEAILDGEAGNLFIQIHVKPHPVFKKVGNDLYMDLRIKLTDAILGSHVDIKTLDGTITLTIPEGVNFFETLRVKGKGVPYAKGKRGDLFVRVVIEIPKKISKDVKKSVEDLRSKGV